jgi:hypothetical protein
MLHVESMIELTYREALRAYWRVYWPSQLLAFGLLFAVETLLVSLSWIWLLFTGVAVSAAALYAFMPRMWSRPYPDFSIAVVRSGDGNEGRMGPAARLQMWGYLWFRQFFGGVFAALLAIPINLALGRVGIQISQPVAHAAGILLIGPLLVKMLIANQFGGFRLEARRG